MNDQLLKFLSRYHESKSRRAHARYSDVVFITKLDTKMAVLFTSWWIEFFFVLFVCLFFYYIHFKLIGSKYWKNRNVFQVDPVFLLGNNWKMLFTENIGFVHEKRYREWKHKKLIGYWSFVSPAVLVTDVDLIKKIMVRDFNYFRDRSININEKRDPLAGESCTT